MDATLQNKWRYIPGLLEASNLLQVSGSLMIVGPPGSGKTELAMDLLKTGKCFNKVDVNSSSNPAKLPKAEQAFKNHQCNQESPVRLA